MSLAALTAALGRSVEPSLRHRASSLAATEASAVKPVLQLAEFPIVIDPAMYTNPFCAANPTGDLRSARAFRDLVDLVPDFSCEYWPSAQSTESIYKAVLNGAQTGGSGLAAEILADAKSAFSNSAQAGLDGSTISWHLVDAAPWNWAADTATLQVKLSLEGDPASPFQVIGDAPLQWRVDGTVSELSTASRLEAVALECQMIMLSRPWLHAELFSASGWSLPPEAPGYCSSGKIDANDGVLPLLPSAVLIGRMSSANGQWSGSDSAKLASVQAGRSVSLGPFPLQSVAQDGTLQGTGELGLIGVVSQLTPFSPQA